MPSTAQAHYLIHAPTGRYRDSRHRRAAPPVPRIIERIRSHGPRCVTLARAIGEIATALLVEDEPTAGNAGIVRPHGQLLPP